MVLDFKNLNLNNLKPQSDFEDNVIIFINDWFSDTETVKVKTSGSTGTPKIFEIEKSRMLNSAKMTCDFLGLKENDTALLCLPVEYISGKMMIVRSIERNLILKVNEPSLNPISDLDERVTFCAMTPLQVENSLDKIHLIKNLIIGGAGVSENLKSKIFPTLQLSNSPTQIFETYGMSETLSHIALKQLFPKEETFFTIFNNIEISADDRSCLKISAPDLNSEILQTNDIVELMNDKQFRFLGRADNIINSGGAKISPEEIESFIKKEISNEMVAVGIPDETLGQKLILVVEGKKDEKLKSKILNFQFQKSFLKPKGIIFVEEIPRTPNGKVDRLKLISNIQHLSFN